MMAEGKQFTADEARQIGAQLGIDWNQVDLEHGSHDRQTDVTHDDPVLAGKVAWAHLKEYPDYYTRLERLEAEAERYWAERNR